MKQIAVISGKGGTGKTVITASLAALAKNKVIVDCDVDAADLHLLLSPKVKEKYIFKSGQSAVTNKEKCIDCGKCREVCRFNAVMDDFTIDKVSCEGCSFCTLVCPVGAIAMEENIAGEWYISDTRFGPFVHANLGIAEDNSGKLVTLIRKESQSLAEREGKDLIIIDGTPGIGCPVIASLSGVDLAIVVTEPTLSGLHDADRVIQVAKHFKVPVQILINKYDLNEEMVCKIEDYCNEQKIAIIGKLKFDKSIVKAMVSGKTAIEAADSNVKDSISQIWNKIKESL